MRRLAGLILLFLFSPVWALIPVKVALDWYINPDHAPLLLASAQGYFKDQGLEVSFISVQNVSASQLVASHQADIGITYEPALIMNVASGVPIIRFASLFNQPLSCVAVLKGRENITIQDLAGKSVAYAGGEFSVQLFKTMLSHAGVDSNSVTMINVNMNLTQALLSRRVAATTDLMRNVEPVQLKIMGYPTQLFFPEKYGVPLYDELIFVANKEEINNPILPKFIMALQRAVTYLQANPEKSWNIVAKRYHNDLAQTADLYRINQAIWMQTVPLFAKKPGKLDVKSYEIFTAYLYQQGLIKKEVPLDSYAVQILQ